MTKIVLKEISKRYNGVQAVKPLSLEIRDGEFLVLLGPPGAGKSSTVKMMAGVEPPSDGEIFFDDKPVTGLPPNKRDIAMVFESYALYPHFTAFDNIAYPLRSNKRALGYTDEQINEKVRQIADLLEISEQLQRRPAFLSGGQRQRVALARCLIRNPQLLLFDEPIAHLDARLRHRLRGELKRIQRERKITTVWATPDYLEAIAMADRVAVLFQGELQQVGPPAAILASPATAEIAHFIGDPPINVLPAKVQSSGGQLWFDVGEFKIPAPPKIANVVEKNFASNFLIGLHPGDMAVSHTEIGRPAFPAKLYVAERLHRKTVLSLSVGSELIKINASPNFQGRIGDTLWVDIQPEKLFIFDAKTGANLIPLA